MGGGCAKHVPFFLHEVFFFFLLSCVYFFFNVHAYVCSVDIPTWGARLRGCAVRKFLLSFSLCSLSSHGLLGVWGFFLLVALLVVWWGRASFGARAGCLVGVLSRASITFSFLG